MTKSREYHPAFQAMQILMDNKSKDYGVQDHARRSYHPFGEKSYYQMMHTKMQRIQNLIELDHIRPGESEYESLKDSVGDLINYSAFFWAYLNDKEYPDAVE